MDRDLRRDVDALAGVRGRGRGWWVATITAILAMPWAVDKCFGSRAKAAPPVILEFQQRPAEPRRWVEPDPGPMCELITGTATPSNLGLLLAGDATEAERRVVVTAIDGCRQTNRKVADPWLVLAVHRIEQAAGAPSGLLLAAWCREASMRTVGAVTKKVIAGDIRDGRPTSIGPFQMQGWFSKWCGGHDLRGELLWSAHCYLSRILHFLPSVTAECGEEAAWRVAEAYTANAPKYMPRGCRARSQHWDILETWQ